MYMLRRCKFGGKWRSWIAHCIFLALVNGFPTSFFSSSRGLRQGDPLIVMEALGKMISAVVSGGLLSNFSVGTEVDISHFWFADNTFLFCGADPTQIIFTIYRA
jgi:hypothetical protein